MTRVGQMKIDSAGAIVTVESTGYSTVVTGLTSQVELSVDESLRLADLLTKAAMTS